MTTSTEITRKVYTSKRDAILDIFTMESEQDAKTILFNLFYCSKDRFLTDDVLIYLNETFSKQCKDLGLDF
jgi:hypothetical protein